ncbi:MAG: hypothetical protein WD097_01680 [Balneolales bacterium]
MITGNIPSGFICIECIRPEVFNYPGSPIFLKKVMTNPAKP